MALTAEETVAFFDEQAAWAGDGFNHALSKGDLRLAGSNGREGVKRFMVSGLILWRLGKISSTCFIATGIAAIKPVVAQRTTGMRELERRRRVV